MFLVWQQEVVLLLLLGAVEKVVAWEVSAVVLEVGLPRWFLVQFLVAPLSIPPRTALLLAAGSRTCGSNWLRCQCR